MVSVVFPAAGAGRRMKAGKNKVFLTLAGVPVLVHTLRRFSAVSDVDELVIATGKNETETVRAMLEGETGLKPWKLVEGGSERQYSVLNGLRAIDAKADIVLVHDAARPFVSRETIEAVIRAAKETGAAIAAVPEKNTIKVVEDGIVVSTPPRSSLWAVQTPQGFRRELLERANAQAEADGFLGTDDASLVERIGAPVAVVSGDYHNIKVTTPEDMVIGEAFLAQKEGE